MKIQKLINEKDRNTLKQNRKPSEPKNGINNTNTLSKVCK